MSNNYNLQSNFKLVSYKRKNRKLKYNTLENTDITESFDQATAIRYHHHQFNIAEYTI